MGPESLPPTPERARPRYRRWIVSCALGGAVAASATVVAAVAYILDHLFSAAPLAELILSGAAVVVVASLSIAAVGLQWEAGFRYLFARRPPSALKVAVALTRLAAVCAAGWLLVPGVLDHFPPGGCSPLAAFYPWSAGVPAVAATGFALAARWVAARAGVATSRGAVVLWILLAPIAIAAVVPSEVSSRDCRVDARDQGPDGWRAAASMRTARVEHRMALLGDGRVLVVGGATSLESELYDPATDRWTSVPGPRTAAGAFVVTALADGTALYVDRASAALFDGSQDRWAPLLGSHPADDTAIRLADSRVVLLGPNGGEIFDPRGNRWRPIPAPVEVGRLAAGTAMLRHEAAVAPAGGGVIVPGTPSSYFLDPDTATWSAVARVPLTNPRVGTTLADGRALVIGTADGEQALEFTFWAADRREWSTPRVVPCEAVQGRNAGLPYCYAERATLLPDGFVLIVTAGEPMSTSSRSAALLLDPTGDRFAPLAAMPEPTRREYAMTNLSDGRVLVAGGKVLEGGFYDPRPRALRSAAVFSTPSNFHFQPTGSKPAPGSPSSANPTPGASTPAGCARATPEVLGALVPGVSGRVAFLGGGRQIWAVNADGSDLTRLGSSETCNSDPAWARDGSRLAYSAQVGSSERRIVSVDSAGGDLRTLTEGYSDSHPAWSRDGTQLAFLRGVTAPEIRVINADGSGMRALPLGTQGVELLNRLSWSPDGAVILVTTSRRDRGPSPGGCRLSLSIVDVNGPGQRVLAQSCSPVVASWSPSGATVAWVGLEGDRVPQTRVVRLVDPDGSHPRTVPGVTDADVVEWGADDQHLLVRTTGGQICSVRTDGLERLCLVADAASGVAPPSWTASP